MYKRQDEVVAVIAGLAATETDGVAKMSGNIDVYKRQYVLSAGRNETAVCMFK